jgi:hypothetical protein
MTYQATCENAERSSFYDQHDHSGKNPAGVYSRGCREWCPPTADSDGGQGFPASASRIALSAGGRGGGRVEVALGAAPLGEGGEVMPVAGDRMGKLLRQARRKARTAAGERARSRHRARNGHAAGNAPLRDHLETDDHALDLRFRVGAGEGNRTLMTSLEGWGSTIELRPRAAPAQPVRAPVSTSSRVAYRACPAGRVSGSGPCPPADQPGQVGYGRPAGCGAAWLARLLWEQEAASSNLAIPTTNTPGQGFAQAERIAGPRP